MALQKNGIRFGPGRLAVLVSGSFLFAAGMLFGFLSEGIISRVPQSDVPPGGETTLFEQGEMLPAASKVGSTTKVEWITFFSCCGHEKVLSDTKSAAGMTLEELKTNYKNYEVRLFTQEHVKLKRDLPLFCPEHFVLRLEEGKLCVSKTDEETMLPYNVAVLSLSPDIVSEEERKQLEMGIPFDSLSEIDAYFEGIDS